MASCQDEIIEKAENQAGQSQQNANAQSRFGSNAFYDLKKEFGKALAKALMENKEVRDFIKEQALKMFDHDYDVLYQMVKDERLSSDKTFREVLLTYFENPESLDAIEKQIPLLTIMVPELPEGSFSAYNWDTETEIPDVAIQVKSKEGIPIMLANGEEFIFPHNMIPGFSVVVVKDNERVTVKNGNNEVHKDGANATIGAYGDFTYEFTDANFDNLNPKNNDDAARVTTSIDQKVIDATNVGVEWHRDYIYYDLTPSNDRGPFSYEFKEHLTSFRFNTGDGYYVISDQTGDPKIKTGGNTTGWTDGYYEFRVTALVNARNTGEPTTYRKFTAKGDQLFAVEYNKIKIIFSYYAYTIKAITPKTLLLGKTVPLINWDLYNYSPTISVKFEEVDETIEETYSETRNSTFATNFGIEGTIKKIGLKFGASLQENSSQVHAIKVIRGSDDLAQDEVNFGDKVVVSKTNFLYSTREYSTGLVSFSVEPLKIQ